MFSICFFFAYIVFANGTDFRWYGKHPGSPLWIDIMCVTYVVIVSEFIVLPLPLYVQTLHDTMSISIVVLFSDTLSRVADFELSNAADSGLLCDRLWDNSLVIICDKQDDNFRSIQFNNGSQYFMCYRDALKNVICIWSGNGLNPFCGHLLVMSSIFI